MWLRIKWKWPTGICMQSRRLVEAYLGGVLDDARATFTIVERAYERGGATILDLLDAARTSRTIQQNYIEALFNYQRNLFQLETAVGQEIDLMMTSANRSLFSVVVLSLLCLTACGKGDQPANSDAATPLHGKTRHPSSRHRFSRRNRRRGLGGMQQDLSLAGKMAYGEDRYSKISSPLQGRVVEVRAHLGDRVKAGAVLLVVDSPDIAQAYSEYVKEDSDLQYATRSHELAKDLYSNKALPLKDLKQAENELVKAGRSSGGRRNGCCPCVFLPKS